LALALLVFRAPQVQVPRILADHELRRPPARLCDSVPLPAQLVPEWRHQKLQQLLHAYHLRVETSVYCWRARLRSRDSCCLPIRGLRVCASDKNLTFSVNLTASSTSGWRGSRSALRSVDRATATRDLGRCPGPPPHFREGGARKRRPLSDTTFVVLAFTPFGFIRKILHLAMEPVAISHIINLEGYTERTRGR